MTITRQNKKSINELIGYQQALTDTLEQLLKLNADKFSGEVDKQKRLDSVMALEFRLAYFKKYFETLKLLSDSNHHEKTKKLLDYFFNQLDNKKTINIHGTMQSVKAVMDSAAFKDEFAKLENNLIKQALFVGNIDKLIGAMSIVGSIAIFTIILAMVCQAPLVVAATLLFGLFFPAATVFVLSLLVQYCYVKYNNMSHNNGNNITFASHITEQRKNLNESLDEDKLSQIVYDKNNTPIQSIENKPCEERKTQPKYQAQHNKFYFFNETMPNSRMLVLDEVDNNLLKVSSYA